MTCHAASEGKLLSKLISSHVCKIVTSCIKEHALDKAARVIYIKRLSGTKLLI